MINEKLGWIGEFTITCIDETNGRYNEEVVRNRITNVALQAMINALDGTDPNLEIKYIAIGNNSDAIDDSDTTLGNELYRFPIATGTNGATGEYTSVFTILDSEAVAQWEEIGIFCGTSATATLNTGTMLSRILYSRDKTSSEEIQFSRLDKIKRG